MKRSGEPTPASRPLRAQPTEALYAQFEAALRAADGLAGAHCLSELMLRGEMAANIEPRLERLWARAAASIPDWLPMRHIESLPQVYAICGRFAARRRGPCNVYLVLLDYSDSRDDRWGFYVGMTAYPPQQRFDQHKAGIRHAGSVLRRGVELLTGPVLHLQRISHADAARIESQLAAALAAAGLLVRGGH